jgi:DNA-binding transcriptional LysR family regulator
MADIDFVQLRRLDMMMLMVFSQTMRRRKLTLVAKQLGLTQSAISHSLARLRGVFEDPLFLRRPHGLEPTARAIQLDPQIEAILSLTQLSLKDLARFDPATVRRRFRIGALDYAASIFGAPLCRLFQQSAPGIDLAIRAAARKEALDLLNGGDVDIVLGFVPGLPASYPVAELYRENYAVVARSNHPSFDGSMRAYVESRHLLVSIPGDARGIVDQVLEKKGLERKIAAVFPLFMPGLATVAETDLIATIPRRLAEQNAIRFNLKVFEPPMEIRPFPVQAIWHRRNAKDPGVTWLVDEIQKMADAQASAGGG